MTKNLLAKMGLVLLVVVSLTMLSGCPNPIVVFPDEALESAVRSALNMPFGYLHQNDLLRLTELNAAGLVIRDLRGLEYCVNLTKLNLHSNRIQSLTPIAGLVNLSYLDLFNNRVRDIEPLSGLVFLSYLDLAGSANEIIKWDALVANALAGGLGSNAVVVVPAEHVLDEDEEVVETFEEALYVLQDCGVRVVAATQEDEEYEL